MTPLQKTLTRIIQAILATALALFPFGLWKLFELLQLLVRRLNT